MTWQQHGKQSAPEGVWILIYASWRTTDRCPFVVAKRVGERFINDDMTWTPMTDDWWCPIPRSGA